MRKKHSGNNYTCDQCDITVTHLSKFKSHMDKKHAEPCEQKCPQCDYKAMKKQYLRNHIKNIMSKNFIIVASAKLNQLLSYKKWKK